MLFHCLALGGPGLVWPERNSKTQSRKPKTSYQNVETPKEVYLRWRCSSDASGTVNGSVTSFIYIVYIAIPAISRKKSKRCLNCRPSWKSFTHVIPRETEAESERISRWSNAIGNYAGPRVGGKTKRKTQSISAHAHRGKTGEDPWQARRHGRNATTPKI